jgi:hypothetical protein
MVGFILTAPSTPSGAENAEQGTEIGLLLSNDASGTDGREDFVGTQATSGLERHGSLRNSSPVARLSANWETIRSPGPDVRIASA